MNTDLTNYLRFMLWLLLIWVLLQMVGCAYTPHETTVSDSEMEEIIQELERQNNASDNPCFIDSLDLMRRERLLRDLFPLETLTL